MHQDKQVEWLKSDSINSFQDLRAVLANKLSTDYPEIQIQQHDNHVVLFKFKNNDDTNSNPVITFCMRIFDDLLVRLWINVKKDARDFSFITMFAMCDIGSQRQEDLFVLLMVIDYVAKKTMLRMKCEACKQKFGNRELQQLNFEIDSDLLRYFESINRGGLTYPSNFLFNVIQCAYNVFNVCYSKYEKEFLKVVNQKQNLLGLFEKHILCIDYFSDHMLVCDVCKV